MSRPLTPEEVEALLAEIFAMAHDYELEEGNPFEDAPDDEEEPEPAVEVEDPGWRQWDFV